MEQLAPGVRRVLAPNPSPMTYQGTNTYVVGTGAVAVIDPGPAMPAHLDAILGGLAPGERVSHILVTHSHLDHSPLAPALAGRTGARVYGFGGSTAGRSEVMQGLADQGLTGGGEGVDAGFAPDETLGDGDAVAGGDWQLTGLWTPGHMANHLSFAFGDALFSGDHVMGWASTMISPPDGDLTQFMASAERLRARPETVYYPGHGAPIADPQARLTWLIEHRRGRERAFLQHLRAAPHSVPALTQAVYSDIPTALLPAAERNTFAHMIDLVQRGIVGAEPRLAQDAKFQAT